MSVPALIRNHVHVSEREVAHRWPDGQWDDSSWEDCTWDSGLELARLCLRASIPATHAEAELLRDAAGERPTGGTNHDDLLRGYRNRYKWFIGPAVLGFDTLWKNLAPGKASAAAGSMGAFPAGHRLRRHQPSFRGFHRVLVVRVDSSDRVWWCDPLAPRDYSGEWVTKADLKRYVDGITPFGGRSVVAKVLVAASPRYVVQVTRTTQLWRPPDDWVYKLPIGTRLIVRPKQFQVGGTACYAVSSPSKYYGYYVPVSRVKILGLA